MKNMKMNDYQNEQLEALDLIRTHLPAIKNRLLRTLEAPLGKYLQFRKETDRFLSDHFSSICSLSCYRNRLSACCSKDAILTFFADMVINVLQSDNTDLDRIAARLQETNDGGKCIYLTPEGCLWRVKPVVCQMFLCDRAEKEIFGSNPVLGNEWDTLKERKKEFTWPDRPVLFDQIETLFLDTGHSSPLMYCHKSPGLVALKRRGRLKTARPPSRRGVTTEGGKAKD